jgi:hypothetical protein
MTTKKKQKATTRDHSRTKKIEKTCEESSPWRSTAAGASAHGEKIHAKDFHRLTLRISFVAKKMLNQNNKP